MKTFVISLKRSQERREYIVEHLRKINLNFELFDAIDGRLLTQEDLEKWCDLEQVNQLRWWLNNGAIGCALSHYQVYKKIVDENLDCALILEDDVVLPSDIENILGEVHTKIQKNEVVLLYYTSFAPCVFSNIGKDNIFGGKAGLYYPLDSKQPLTATAYIIDQEAAKNMLNIILPIRVAADNWNYFYEQGGFRSFRCLYPSAVKTANHKSSIDYISATSLKGKFLLWIDKYKIPFFYQSLRWLRRKRLSRMQDHFTLSNEISPVYSRISNVDETTHKP